MNTAHTIIKNDCSLEAKTLQTQFAQDVLTGLSQPRKSLPCKYIYDDIGSDLFCKIMELPEYYLTDCEMNILNTHKSTISQLIGHEHCNLIELGAGDGTKTKILIDHFLENDHDIQYCPVDISESAVTDLSEHLSSHYPRLEINGLITDYFDGLKWLSQQDSSRNVVLFLGSNIGNFSPDETISFLKHLRVSINNGDYLLIGVDLKKDIDIMVRAYNDSQGISEKFNMNILSRINRELGGEFDLDRFRYRSIWDEQCNAIKSYQVSTQDQEVHIRDLNRSFTFYENEPIHTESSHKFTIDQCTKMAEATGFRIVEHFFDERNYFVDSLWTAE
jgi:dimethylhistidine N-methyltransferase